MPFDISFEWYGNASEASQALLMLAALLGTLVLIGTILVAAAKKTPVALATATGLATLFVGHLIVSRELPEIELAQDILFLILFASGIVFGMQWQKKRG